MRFSKPVAQIQFRWSGEVVESRTHDLPSLLFSFMAAAATVSFGG